MRSVLFFDWDGTIADSMALCIGQIRLALQRMGLPDLPDSQIRKCNGPTYEQAVPILGIPEELGKEFLRQRQIAEMEVVPGMQRLFPGVREMLDALHGRAMLVIVSNGLAEYIDLSIRVMGMTGVFDRIQPLVPGRTKAELLHQLIEELKPDRALMIGDRLGDIDAGRVNGLPTVAACYGYGNDAEYAQADYQAATVEDLHALLEEWVDQK